MAWCQNNQKSADNWPSVHLMHSYHSRLDRCHKMLDKYYRKDTFRDNWDICYGNVVDRDR